MLAVSLTFSVLSGVVCLDVDSAIVPTITSCTPDAFDYTRDGSRVHDRALPATDVIQATEGIIQQILLLRWDYRSSV